ncbi:hypothetical protein EV714DRAFT_275489 [Schizophyllum commune]
MSRRLRSSIYALPALAKPNNKPFFVRERVETTPNITNPEVEENAMAAHIQLTVKDVATLTDLGKKAEIHGGIYPPAYAATISADCITLAEWEARK